MPLLDAAELERLQNSYAYAVDNRDADALLAVFHEDASLAMYRPDAAEPYAELTGHAQLVFIADAMRERYVKTMHVLSNHMSEVRDETATGTVYCVAHHLIDDGGALRQFVVHLRYDDTFRRDGSGAWRIGRRELRFQWSTEHAVLDWDEGAVRGRLA